MRSGKKFQKGLSLSTHLWLQMFHFELDRTQPASAVNWLRRPQQELEGVPPVDLLGSEYATKILKKLIQQAVEGTYS